MLTSHTIHLLAMLLAAAISVGFLTRATVDIYRGGWWPMVTWAAAVGLSMVLRWAGH